MLRTMIPRDSLPEFSMCGRFSQTQSPEAIARAFQLEVTPDWQPGYNLAPTQPIPAILNQGKGSRQFYPLRWGLIPSWAKDTTIGHRLINARAETVAEKPAFRAAFRQRRCLVVADGFYEWQGQNGKKQPFYIRRADHGLFAFAGLWERWQGPDGQTIDSCTLLTTTPNEVMEPIHDRMPVILQPGTYDRWLDPTLQKPEALLPLLIPDAEADLIAYPVSARVNSPKNNDPTCIQPVGE